MSLALFPAAIVSLSAFTYKVVWYDEKTTTSLRPLIDTCLRNSAGWFKADTISSSFQPLLNDVLCTRMAFLKEVFSDRSGCGAFLVYGSILFPLILRLSYKAASPNTQSVLQGLILPSLAMLLTSSNFLLLGTGIGVFLPALISLFYVLGALNNQHSTLMVPLPAVTRGVYGANLATILTCFLFVVQFVQGGDSTLGETKWWEEYVHSSIASVVKTLSPIFVDLFPLIVGIPLLALGLNDVQRPSNEETATRYLKDNYLASEVAYGFERTWAYYRQAGLLSSLAYAYGASRVFRDVYAQRPLTPATQYLLLVSLSLSLVHLTIAVSDSQLTPKDVVDEEAKKAIAKAPAGNPGVEDNPRALAILALVVGPSLPAMLWAARGEEIRGWKGRRSWRLAIADDKSSKLIK